MCCCGTETQHQWLSVQPNGIKCLVRSAADIGDNDAPQVHHSVKITVLSDCISIISREDVFKFFAYMFKLFCYFTGLNQ